jgi:hypothetical protein
MFRLPLRAPLMGSPSQWQTAFGLNLLISTFCPCAMSLKAALPSILDYIYVRTLWWASCVSRSWILNLFYDEEANRLQPTDLGRSATSIHTPLGWRFGRLSSTRQVIMLQ